MTRLDDSAPAGGRLNADAIAAATPVDRNRYADLLRLSSITVVVLGHWLMAVITVRDGRIEGEQLLEVVPVTQWLTWAFQVMPVFFFVGGYANALGWSRMRAAGLGYRDWMRRRARRLLRPVVPLLIVWLPLTALLVEVGVPADLIKIGTQVVIVPTWFLAAYLVVVALAPLTYAAHERFGFAALAGLCALAVAVDAAALAGVPLIGWLNFLWVWAAVHQGGYLWHDGRLPRRPRHGLLIAAAGFGVLLLLTGPLGYTVSMVGIEDGGRSNNTPPTVALLALAVAQVGLVIVLREQVARWLQRPRVWAATVIGGSRAMTAYLWHTSAMVLAAGLLYPLRLWPVTETVNGLWWATRPLWIAVLLLPLAVGIWLFGRFEHPRPAPPTRLPAAPGAVTAVLGVVAVTTGLAMLALGGMHQPGDPLGLPLLPAVLCFGGFAALGVLTPGAEPAAAS